MQFFWEETKTCIYILGHSFTLTRHMLLKSFLLYDKTHLFYIINIMAADDIMILTKGVTIH